MSEWIRIQIWTSKLQLHRFVDAVSLVYLCFLVSLESGSLFCIYIRGEPLSLMRMTTVIRKENRWVGKAWLSWEGQSFPVSLTNELYFRLPFCSVVFKAVVERGDTQTQYHQFTHTYSLLTPIWIFQMCRTCHFYKTGTVHRSFVNHDFWLFMWIIVILCVILQFLGSNTALLLL